MPLTRISLMEGKPAEYRATLAEQLYLAMHESFDVPEDDYFMTIQELAPENLRFSRSYMDVERSDDFVIIQITCSNTRSLEKKQALYRKIVERLTQATGLRPEDVFINLVETEKENWSFGHGLAQYV